MRTSAPQVVLLTTIILSGSLSAEDRISITPRTRSRSAVLSDASVRVDVRLLQVGVIVTDLRGQPLTDLPQNAFRVFEDDIERPITAFSVTEMPMSATLVFDTSRSMRGRVGDARSAVERFLKMSGPGDEFSLVGFSNRPELLTPMTTDLDEISRELSWIEPRGWTALFDAIFLATNHVRKGRNERKVLIVFSDGADNNSRYSESELISMLRETDVQVYAVSMFGRSRSLERIADETGGRSVWVRKIDDLPDAMEAISRQIRSTYLLGCIPGEVRNDGRYHRIRVQVQPPAGVEDVHASWRRGYMAPVE